MLSNINDFFLFSVLYLSLVYKYNIKTYYNNKDNFVKQHLRIQINSNKQYLFRAHFVVPQIVIRQLVIRQFTILTLFCAWFEN